MRKRRRVAKVLFAAGFVWATSYVVRSRQTATADAEPAFAESHGSIFSLGESRALRQQLESTEGELNLVQAQYQRADQIIKYSTKFGVPAGMSARVFDASVRERIDPELAFRLVKLESDFNDHAVSRVGALGLTQLMPSTARLYQKEITREQLFNADTNLRVGFRYLRTLLDQYKGNVRLALLAYNRGDDAVTRDVRAGINPGNGYDQWVLKGYKGTGVIQ